MTSRVPNTRVFSKSDGLWEERYFVFGSLAFGLISERQHDSRGLDRKEASYQGEEEGNGKRFTHILTAIVLPFSFEPFLPLPFLSFYLPYYTFLVSSDPATILDTSFVS